ncbi:hypothetical protein D3C78_1527100 [compost metagenome]
MQLVAHVVGDAVAAQQRTDARLQLREFEGLDQVVVGAGVQPGDAIFHAVQRGQQQDRQRRLVHAHVAQHLQAALAGQADIEDHRVERLGQQLLLRGEAVGGVADAEAELAQAGEQGIGEDGVVFG